ncbi:hypothetical protein Ddye_021683 [Dipteronia dyeriana]|uniref:peroxidase n=1 Tax=Dipteronia dyeriana TaxID=168575 RepID=A0AAD9WXS2_9ROSI|nr:hypothetical protein Ddye_021683 [Dipteronia dyeriana]
MRDTITNKQITTATATLYRFFHDTILNDINVNCPNTISCADILAIATCDLINMVGGPHYNVVLGRKDGKISKASTVDDNLAKLTMPMSQILDIFKKRNQRIWI